MTITRLKLYILMFLWLFTFYGFQFFNILDFFINVKPAIIFLIILIPYFAYTLSKFQIRDIIKCFFIVSCVYFLVIFIFGNLFLLSDFYSDRYTRLGFNFKSIFENFKYAFNFNDGFHTRRNSFGFNYPTTACLSYSSILLAFVYLYKDKLNLKTHIKLLLLTLLIYIYTLVRGAFILFFLQILLLVLEQIKIPKKYWKFIYLIIPLFLIISILCALVLYDFSILFKLTSGRFSNWKEYLSNDSLKLINFSPDLLKFNLLALDNTYLFPFYFAGILPTIIVFYLYYLLLKYLIAHDEYILLLIFIVYCIYGFIEITLFYQFCFFLLILPTIVKEKIKRSS